MEKKLRTIIVDDEPLARRLLRTLLDEESDIEIVAECEDGAKGIQAIETLHPELVFLDVQMPEISGFDVLEVVGPDAIEVVIFVTAYDQYAVRAFEVHALDYLLKPFDPAVLREKLGRYCRENKCSQSTNATHVAEAI